MTSYRKKIELARVFEAVAWIAAGVCAAVTQFAGMTPVAWLGVLGVLLCGAGAWFVGSVRDRALGDEAAVDENRAWQQHLREERERAAPVETRLPGELVAAVHALVENATAAGHAIADTCEHARAVMGNLSALDAHVSGVHEDNEALRGEVLKLEDIQAVLRGQPRRRGPPELGTEPIPASLREPAQGEPTRRDALGELAELANMIAGTTQPKPA